MILNCWLGMTTRTYTNNYSTYANDNAIMKDIVHKIAICNNVSITYIDSKLAKAIQKDKGFYSVEGVYIEKGNVIIHEDSVEHFHLVLHELLHILSVPQQLRYLMDQDTQKSYKIIKNRFKHVDKQHICTESAVLGAHHLVCKHYNYKCSIQGSFFTGTIYDSDSITDVKPEWIERGMLLLKSIFWL